MNFNINDFLEYANTGTAPTVYSRQKEQNKIPTSAEISKRPYKAIDEGFSVLKRIPTARLAKPPINTVEATKPALELVMYSERSFAIFGDTKPIKAQLEGLFGKFNRYLKKDGIATPGFIFSIGRLDAVKKSLNL